jgi:hypothetical protein
LKWSGDPTEDAEMIAALYLPDPALPAHLFERRAALSPVRRMLATLLRNAIDEYRLTTAICRRGPRRATHRAAALRDDVMVWMQSNEVACERSFPFVMVCQALDLDPAAVRAAVLKP